MFAASHFGSDLFAPQHFYAGGVSSATGLVLTSWKRTRAGRQEPLAGYVLDYWVIDNNDELVASGQGTTDANGVLSFYVTERYKGADVLVIVNNLESDMDPSGKIKGQQVATVQ